MTLGTAPRSVVDGLRDAMNAKDRHALSELFTEDAEFVSIDGVRLHGRDAIAAGHAQVFSQALAEHGLKDIAFAVLDAGGTNLGEGKEHANRDHSSS